MSVNEEYIKYVMEDFNIEDFISPAVLRALEEELFRELAFDTKYRDFVLSMTYRDERIPVEDGDNRAENLAMKPRFDPDKAIMSL